MLRHMYSKQVFNIWTPLVLSRRWLFNKCHFISFIRIILIDTAYFLKENLIGIFPVGVVFLFISFVKYI